MIDHGAIPEAEAEMHTPLVLGMVAYCAAPPAQHVGAGLYVETFRSPLNTRETAVDAIVIAKLYEGMLYAGVGPAGSITPTPSAVPPTTRLEVRGAHSRSPP